MFRNDTCLASAAKHVSTTKRMKEDGHTAKYLGVSRAILTGISAGRVPREIGSSFSRYLVAAIAIELVRPRRQV